MINKTDFLTKMVDRRHTGIVFTASLDGLKPFQAMRLVQNIHYTKISLARPSWYLVAKRVYGKGDKDKLFQHFVASVSSTFCYVSNYLTLLFWELMSMSNARQLSLSPVTRSHTSTIYTDTGAAHWK